MKRVVILPERRTYGTWTYDLEGSSVSFAIMGLANHQKARLEGDTFNFA